jgi:hypothetical protein
MKCLNLCTSLYKCIIISPPLISEVVLCHGDGQWRNLSKTWYKHEENQAHLWLGSMLFAPPPIESGYQLVCSRAHPEQPQKTTTSPGRSLQYPPSWRPFLARSTYRAVSSPSQVHAELPVSANAVPCNGAQTPT